MADHRHREQLAAYDRLTGHPHYGYRACAPDPDNPNVTAANPQVRVDVWLTPDDEPQTARPERERQALTACVGCPIRTQCLTYALGDQHGPFEPRDIWGGMTARQRSAHLKRLRREAAAALTTPTASLPVTATGGGESAADEVPDAITLALAAVQPSAPKPLDLVVLRALAAHRTPATVAAAAGLTITRANWHRSKLCTALGLDGDTTTRTQLLYAARRAGHLDPTTPIRPDRGITAAIPSRQADVERAHALPGMGTLADIHRLTARTKTPRAATGQGAGDTTTGRSELAAAA